jgi:hypothetical protein
LGSIKKEPEGPWVGCEALYCQEGYYCEYGECKPFGEYQPERVEYEGPSCDDCASQCPAPSPGERLAGTGCGEEGCECYYESAEPQYAPGEGPGEPEDYAGEPPEETTTTSESSTETSNTGNESGGATATGGVIFSSDFSNNGFLRYYFR